MKLTAWNKVSLLSATIIGLVIGLMGPHDFEPRIRSAWVKATLTDEEVSRIQTAQIVDYVQFIYAGRPGIPSGDITRILVGQWDAFHPFIPDVPFDSMDNERVRQSMGRLRVDFAAGQVADDRGRRIRVLSDGNRVDVKYGT